MTYRICGWARHFENSASRKLKQLLWVAIPNSLNDEKYLTLIDHQNGAAHFGAWMAIVQIASKQPLQEDRGKLPNGKNSQTIGGICHALGRISRLPASLFEEVLPRLIEIGLLEISAEFPSTSAESPNTSAESPSTSGKSADTGRKLGNKETRDSAPSELVKAIDIEKVHASDARTQNSNGNGWTAFQEAYRSSGRQTTEADFANCKPLWTKLELTDQLACVKGIRRDIEKYKYSGPEFWPKPRKYVFEREWDRKPQPPKKGGKRDLMEGVFDA